MLGRQGFQVETQFRRRYEAALQKAGRPGNRFDYLQDDGYSETLFAKLGFGKIESLDMSDFEGATILHDLNAPVPKALEQQFDLIFDGGTIEHVFNVPTALANVFRMLRPGGMFVSANGMNGWVGHGMYQFNPELVWTFWQRGCGCRVHSCLGLTKLPGRARALDFPDPANTGVRLRLRGKIPEGRVYLYYEVERLLDAAMAGPVLQSDYQTKWSGHDMAVSPRPHADLGAAL